MNQMHSSLADLQKLHQLQQRLQSALLAIPTDAPLKNPTIRAAVQMARFAAMNWGKRLCDGFSTEQLAAISPAELATEISRITTMLANVEAAAEIPPDHAAPSPMLN